MWVISTEEILLEVQLTTIRNSLPRSRIQIQTTLQKQTRIFVPVNLWVSRAAATKKPTITMTISDESHWYVPALASAPSHTLSLAEKIGSWAQLLLIGSDHCTHFLQLAGDYWSLASYQEPLQRVEIPSDSANSCILAGRPAIDGQRIKAESQGTAAQRPNLSQSNPTCDWLDAMGENDTWWQ